MIIPVGMVYAVGSLSTNNNKPFGPELQVYQMFA